MNINTTTYLNANEVLSCQNFENKIKFILMDLNQPEELIEQVHEKCKNSGIELVITGHQTPEKWSLSESKIVHFLRRPFHISQMILLLESILIKKRKRNQLNNDNNLQRLDGLRVLVAEDNEFNQKVVNRMLQKMGITPVIVCNGRKAVEEMEKQDFDLILM